MNPKAPLESIVAPFIKGFGGEVISELLQPNMGQTPTNADYLFREYGIIAELKSLEQGSFGEGYKNKLSALLANWHQRGLLQVYGMDVVISLDELQPECQREWLELLAKPVQNNILTKANQQIKKTKALLDLPDAKGLLLLASDGNEDLQPIDVWSLLAHMLTKKHQDGSLQYSHIDGMVYFNPRMPVLTPHFPWQEAVFFAGAYRHEGDDEMMLFLRRLDEAWRKYIGISAGRSLPQYQLNSFDHFVKAATFPAGRRSPRIDVDWDQ